MTPVLKELLVIIRQHEGFRELLKSVEKPSIRPFMKSRAAQVEQARSEWIHDSGRQEQHEKWLQFLSGSIPENGEITEEDYD